MRCEVCDTRDSVKKYRRNGRRFSCCKSCIDYLDETPTEDLIKLAHEQKEELKTVSDSSKCICCNANTNLLGGRSPHNKNHPKTPLKRNVVKFVDSLNLSPKSINSPDGFYECENENEPDEQNGEKIEEETDGNKIKNELILYVTGIDEQDENYVLSCEIKELFKYDDKSKIEEKGDGDSVAKVQNNNEEGTVEDEKSFNSKNSGQNFEENEPANKMSKELKESRLIQNILNLFNPETNLKEFIESRAQNAKTETTLEDLEPAPVEKLIDEKTRIFPEEVLKEENYDDKQEEEESGDETQSIMNEENENTLINESNDHELFLSEHQVENDLENESTNFEEAKVLNENYENNHNSLSKEVKEIFENIDIKDSFTEIAIGSSQKTQFLKNEDNNEETLYPPNAEKNLDEESKIAQNITLFSTGDISNDINTHAYVDEKETFQLQNSYEEQEFPQTSFDDNETFSHEDNEETLQNKTILCEKVEYPVSSDTAAVKNVLVEDNCEEDELLLRALELAHEGEDDNFTEDLDINSLLSLIFDENGDLIEYNSENISIKENSHSDSINELLETSQHVIMRENLNAHENENNIPADINYTEPPLINEQGNNGQFEISPWIIVLIFLQIAQIIYGIFLYNDQ